MMKSIEKPLRMNPAYRYGDSTPWGGNKLRELYHRDIPDERTGESLEISAIDGLESTFEGTALTTWLKHDGEKILGTGFADLPFPLLLKLLCATDRLSVQVHPDDKYAALHEHKLGKTEAWVILQADPGASILYGLKDGVTTEVLAQTLQKGEDVEALIRRVPVQAGDVFYIPSGMVHGIGGGIVLYEIQQSSDVTYRLWDYNRVNARGEKRQLHVEQSLAVIQPVLKGQITHLPAIDAESVRLLDVSAFTLDCVCVNKTAVLPAHPKSFRILTALEPLEMQMPDDPDWIDRLHSGDSVLIPAACASLILKGNGRALIAAP